MSVTMQQRRDTAANWTSANPVLHSGEIGLETDTKLAKMGDGTTAWTSLAYWEPAGAGGGSGTVTSVAVESANGFAGTVADGTTTPQLTLSTTITGLLKGVAGAIAAAVAGTDYLAPGGNGSQLTGLTQSQVSGLVAALAALAPAASPTFTGTVTVPATVNATDAAQKAYVDSVAQGLDSKPSVAALASSDITLSGTQTVDGVAVTTGNRVLCTAQTASAQSGIWVVASGAWSRPADFASGSIQSGASAFVEGGTSYGSSGWVLTGTSPVTVDTGAQTWTQFSGAGEISAGTGLSKTGNTLAIASSAALPGSPTTTTQSGGDNSTKVATTAFVAGAVPSSSSPLATTAGGLGTDYANLAAILAALLAAGGGAMGAALAPKVIALTDGSTISVNAALGNDFYVTIAGNRTVSAPSNPADGQTITFEIIQDGTGSRTVTWTSGTGGYSFGSGSAPTLSTAAGATDQVAFRYSVRKQEWLYLGSMTGF